MVICWILYSPEIPQLLWKRIEHGPKLVKKGIIWRVGDGSSIRTWRDPWIPRGHNFRPVTPKGNCRFNRVSDFLDDNGAWVKDKEMKNDDRDENSPVETIEGRLKRLHTNGIDGRKRLRLREE